MKKICFVLEHHFKYSMGGAELQAFYIAKNLMRYYDIHYIFVENPRKISQKKSEDNDNITLHKLKNYTYKIFGRILFLNFFELQKLLKKINPDLVYQRGGNSYTGITASWSKKYRKNMVFGISSDDNCRYKGILNLNSNLLNYPFKILNCFFTINGIKNADQIIAQTNYQKKLLKNNFNRDAIVIPNALPIPEKSFKKTYPPIVVWIGNIKPLKRPEIFFKLAEKCKDLDVKYLYAGRPHKSSYQDVLIAKTKKLSNLKYLGDIPFQKTNELLAKASLLVNTSTTEGFSNTYIQAWMRETPVVTLNCDPDNIIKNQKIGYHSGNFKELVKDVRYLIENENERRNMSKKARKYAVKNHDIRKIGNKYFNLFWRLLNQ